MKLVKDEIQWPHHAHAHEFEATVGAENFKLVQGEVGDWVWGAMSHLHATMKAEIELNPLIKSAFGEGMNAGLSAAEMGTKLHTAIGWTLGGKYGHWVENEAS